MADERLRATGRCELLTWENVRRPATVVLDGEDLSNSVYEADPGIGRVGVYVRGDDGKIRLGDNGEPVREHRQARRRLVITDARGRKWCWRPPA